jgi:allantoinase
MALDMLLSNGHVVTPYGHLGPDIGIGIRGGKITAIGAPDDLGSAKRELNLEGTYLVPGIIDCHVHTRSPGDEYKEDWTTATRAAAAGGVTTLLAMPNTDPMIDRPEHLKTVYEIADRDALVDHQSYAVITSENLDQIHPLDEAGVAGYKVFLGTTFGEIEPPNDGELYEAMEEIAKTGKRIGFHEENDEILTHFEEKAKAEGHNRPIDHARSRPVIAETEAVSRTTLFSEHTNCPVHMFHLSSGTAAEIVAKGKNRGVNVTAETMPHYLWFSEAVMEEKGNEARVQPPIRDENERERLWTVGVRENGIDCIATDHAPHTAEEKGLDHPFENTWESISGFVGLEAEVPAMLSFVDQGRLSMKQWVYMHSTRPAQIWGMYPNKGSLWVGTDADFTVVDPERTWTLNHEDLQSKSKATPFDGTTFTGTVTKTIVRGNTIYEDGEILGEPGDGQCIDVGQTSGP